MAIELTKAANDKIAELKKQRQTPNDLLRVGLKSGGCSGFSYQIEFVSSADEKDRVFDFEQSVQVCVDPKSYLFLNGMTIDYEDGLLKSGLVFKNPAAIRTCGCGESFSV